jgi:HPt (histidine-containing phosphotransfer) domain-containing protein
MDDHAALSVDWERFEMLTAGDKTFGRELIELYLHSAANILLELRDGCAAGDRELLRKAAHKLKGASANVSAVGIADLCKTLELAAEQGGPAHLLQQVEAIEQMMAGTQQAMQRYASTL